VIGNDKFDRKEEDGKQPRLRRQEGLHGSHSRCNQRYLAENGNPAGRTNWCGGKVMMSAIMITK
jgi:hypothetical protein